MYGLEYITAELKTRNRNYLELIAQSLNDRVSQHKTETNCILRLSNKLSKDQLTGVIVCLAGELIKWTKEHCDYDEPAVAHLIGGMMDEVEDWESSFVEKACRS